MPSQSFIWEAQDNQDEVEYELEINGAHLTQVKEIQRHQIRLVELKCVKRGKYRKSSKQIFFSSFISCGIRYLYMCALSQTDMY